MKAVLLSVFAITIVCVQLPAQDATSRPESPLMKSIRQVQPSIVQIGVTFRNYPERTKRFLEKTPDVEWHRASICPDPCVFFDFPAGTGFLANEDGYVITAKHVMDAMRTEPKFADAQGKFDLGQRIPSVRIQMPNVGELDEPGPKTRGAFYAADFQEVDEDPVHDLALLRLRYNPFSTDAGVLHTAKGDVKILQVKASKFSTSRPDEGEPIAVSGYPLSSPVLITTSGAIASSWVLEQRDLPSGAPRLSVPHVSDAYLADMHVNHGNSGGPVFSVPDGAVIGVCVSVVPDSLGNGWYNSGLSLMVPAKYVLELLNKNHVRWAAP